MKNADSLRPLLFVAAVCELAIGSWLVIYAVSAMATIFNLDRSSTLVSIVKPMGIIGLLLLAAGVCTLGKKITASVVLLALVFAASVVRWLVNIRYVFPFGNDTLFTPKDALSTIEIWKSQQFAFVVIIGILLTITIASIIKIKLQNK